MQSLRQAVCVIVHDEKASKVACVHYANDSWSTVPAWTVPGGKVEEGERLDEAAARELHEESGLVVAPEDLRLVHTIQVKAGWDGKGPFLLSVFAATSWRGELTNTEPDKHLAVLWMDASALPTPMFPTSHAALTAYLAGDGRGSPPTAGTPRRTCAPWSGPEMPGRHRRPPTGEQAALPADIDLRLLAITQGRTVTEEGVATLPGSAHAYAYRTLYRPDGSAERLLERLAPGPLRPPGLRPTD